MKGLIALDIDGTTVPTGQKIALEVAQYLFHLVHDHWVILFVTGRSFEGVMNILGHLPFPHYLAVQNGALLLEMPSQNVLKRKYLDQTIFPKMEEICAEEPTDFVLISGFEHKDIVFYRPELFSEYLLKYVQARSHAFQETWISVKHFNEIDFGTFPSIKCFGSHPSAQKIASRIESELGLHAPLIRDPFDQTHYVVQATHASVSKGQSLQDLLKHLNKEGVVIAAGDDYNDCSMWEESDIRIVMQTAPEELLKQAHILAPPAEEKGIIVGLKQALKLAEEIK